MDVLYIHPAKQEAQAEFGKFRASPFYPLMPVGVIGMVNLLRTEGWEVQGLNLPLEIMLRTSFDLDEWLAAIDPPKLVMIDLHWYEHCFGAIDVARHVRRMLPTAQIVVGGLTATFFAAEILETHPEIDYVIRGDGEVPLLQLVEHVCGAGTRELEEIPNLSWRAHHKVCNSLGFYTATAAELDSLDFVTTDWLLHAPGYGALQYTGGGIIDPVKTVNRGHWLTVGRGCVFNCIYCGGGKKSHADLAARNGYVMRDPRAVVRDMEQLSRQGYKQVSLSLDIATFPAKWWRSFFAEMQTRRLCIGIYNEFFQLPSPEFIRQFGETVDLDHTEVAISPLSGNEAVRELNGKHYTNARFLQMLTHLQAYRVPIFVYFSLNLPGETLQTFRETLKLAQSVGQAYPPDLLRMLNPCHTLDPVSPMSRRPAPFKIYVEYHTFRDYYDYCRVTAWEPKYVQRGQMRGFTMEGRPTATVEQMAKIWDMFAQAQKFRCFPVARVW